MTITHQVLGRFTARHLGRKTKAVTKSIRSGIRRRPFHNVAAAIATGIVAGVAVMLILRVRD